MKNFVLLALTATIAYAAADADSVRREEPDNSEFPDEWTKSPCGADS